MNRKEKARVEDKPVRSSENTNVKFNKYFGKGNYKNDNKLFVKCKNNLLYKFYNTVHKKKEELTIKIPSKLLGKSTS